VISRLQTVTNIRIDIV